MYAIISPNNLEQLLKREKINLIDVREPYEYRLGHIKEAINIPLNSLLNNPVNYLTFSQKYFFICQSGGRSSTVADYLSKRGYDCVNVLGGYNVYAGKLV